MASSGLYREKHLLTLGILRVDERYGKSKQASIKPLNLLYTYYLGVHLLYTMTFHECALDSSKICEY